MNKKTGDKYRDFKGYSASALKEAYKSYNHYLLYKNKQWKTTDAMQTGKSLHLLLFEPDVYKKSVFVIPGGTKKAEIIDRIVFVADKLGIDPEINDSFKVDQLNGVYSLLREEETELIFIKDDGQIKRMARNVENHPMAKLLIKGGVAEKPIYGKINGNPVKVKPDYFVKNTIIEFKTASDAHPDSFGRDCVKYGYDLAAALYLDTANQKGDEKEFYFIVAESTESDIIEIYQPDETFFKIGRMKYREAMNKIEIGIKEGKGGYTNGEINYLSLPGWEKNRFFKSLKEEKKKKD
ncbi:PD-(D/E)XK nuclease-like domain-containing protein [Candidatus Pacearchaeota archaeon]|nr:PD-(D/E)XK nuclease-like domain-containing protein [Candidatus Pacearchaeota archaeon]